MTFEGSFAGVAGSVVKFDKKTAHTDLLAVCAVILILCAVYGIGQELLPLLPVPASADFLSAGESAPLIIPVSSNMAGTV